MKTRDTAMLRLDRGLFFSHHDQEIHCGVIVEEFLLKIARAGKLLSYLGLVCFEDFVVEELLLGLHNPNNILQVKSGSSLLENASFNREASLASNPYNSFPNFFPGLA